MTYLKFIVVLLKVFDLKLVLFQVTASNNINGQELESNHESNVNIIGLDLWLPTVMFWIVSNDLEFNVPIFLVIDVINDQWVLEDIDNFAVYTYIYVANALKFK